MKLIILLVIFLNCLSFIINKKNEKIFGKNLHEACNIHAIISECAMGLVCGVGEIKTPNCVADVDMKCKNDRDCAALLKCLPNNNKLSKILKKNTCQIPNREKKNFI
jgi:hypothetical protein